MQGKDIAAGRARRTPSGIRERHSRECATRSGKRCSCIPSFEAVVGFGKRGERKRKTFPTLGEAKAWRAQLLAAKTRSRLRALEHHPPHRGR